MGTQQKDTKTGSYTFTKSSIAGKAVRGGIPVMTPPSNYDDGGPKIGLKRWKKVGYKFNPLVDEVEPPQVLLVNRRLQRICEVINISNFRETFKELNQANEISFTVYKELNGIEQPFYDRIADLGVVHVNGEFFEIGITNQEDASLKKNVVGVSLGYAELSQVITTLQINTDEDWDRDELKELTKNNERYTPATIFYRPMELESTDDGREWCNLTSFMTRLVSEIPHYQIGTVDETLRCMQRTFSWEDTDIVTILNDVGQELGCVFDIMVDWDTNGHAVRKINAYDLCYCKYCWNQVRGTNAEFEASADTYRNIQNAVCMNCKDTIDIYTGNKRTGAEDIVDIGHDTGIFLSTENLTDDITVDGNKDGIKTTFRVVAGDDYMTDTVQGLNPSGDGKITIFPPYMMKNFSPELYRAYEKYRKAVEVADEPYKELLNVLYPLYDIWKYLKSGKMPVFDEPIVDADVAFNDVAIDIANNFQYLFYIDKLENYIDQSGNGKPYAVKNSITKMMKTFMPKGFGVTVKVYSVNSDNKFLGSITVYSTSNQEDTITATRSTSGVTITYGKNNKKYDGNPNFEDMIRLFINNITFRFANSGNNTDYANYIERYCASLLAENQVEFVNEQEKNWSLYSYERLAGWRDGYQACIDTLAMKIQSAETDFEKTTLTGKIETYARIRDNIEIQLDILKNQLYAVGTFLGKFDPMFLDSQDELLPFVYAVNDKVSGTDMKNRFTDNASAFNSLVDRSEWNITTGDGLYKPCCDIGAYPFKCRSCGSTNVRRLVTGEAHCRNCGETREEKLVTYRSIATDIVRFYNNFSSFISNLATSLASITGDVNMRERLDPDRDKQTVTGLRDAINHVLEIRSSEKKPYFLDDELFAELLSYKREQVYSNSNYISEGLTDEEVIQQATELQEKAKRELARACMPQYTITASVASILALEPYDFLGVDYNTDLANFAINNYVRVKFDDDIYKLRIASIELTYPMSDKISVSFTNAERYENGFSSDIASILSQAQSMATNFDAVSNQSEKGVVANNLFDKIKQQGLDTSLMAVNGGRNQDVVIDDKGILLRELNEYTNEYDPHQTKMVSNNIVMTDDNWQHAKLAIGLTLNPEWTEANDTKRHDLETQNRKYLYGVYADAIVGDFILTKHMRRIGNGNGDDCTVDIDANGIKIEAGYFDVGKDNNRVIIDPAKKSPNNTSNTYKMISASHNGTEVFNVMSDGSAKFSGTIVAHDGEIANWTIKNDCLCTNNSVFKGSGMYFGKDGLSIKDSFWVQASDGKAYFKGDITATGGTITGTLNVTGKLLGGSDGVFEGIIKATGGSIGQWTISGSELIAQNGSAMIYTKGHKKELTANNDGTGYYIGPEGINIGEFFIQTNSTGTSASQGLMALPRARVVPYMYDGNKYPGSIQFIGSKLATNLRVPYNPQEFEQGEGTTWDAVYLCYGFYGDKDASGGTFKKAAFNCLEIRTNRESTRNGASSDNLGRLRVDNLVIGKHSLVNILEKVYKTVYKDKKPAGVSTEDWKPIDWDSWASYNIG